MVLGDAGWVLFMVFCGVGFVSLPLSCFQEFSARPRKTIPRSEYIARAKDLGKSAKHIKVRLHGRQSCCRSTLHPGQQWCME
jgi:hypothetical protein